MDVGGSYTVKALQGTTNSLIGALDGTYTLTVGEGNYAGKITNYNSNTASSGTLSLKKISSETLTLGNANNDYSGGTTISAGTISIANGGALGSGAITFDGGALAATADLTLTQSLAVNNDNTINLQVANGVTMTANITNTSAGYSVSGVADAGTSATGKVQLTNIGSDLTGHLSVASGYTLDLSGKTQIGVFSTLEDIQGTLSKSDGGQLLIKSGFYKSEVLTGTLAVEGEDGEIMMSGWNDGSDSAKDKTVIVQGSGKLSAAKLWLTNGAVLEIKNKQSIGIINLANNKEASTLKVSTGGELTAVCTYNPLQWG
jgi:autotransporter-associated beta strand protein